MWCFRALLAASCFIAHTLSAQELFVYSEPASNMAANTMGIRLSNWLMDEAGTGKVNYHLIPELMWGVNKRLMIHAEGFLSNRAKGFTAEGGAVYAKYRFYSNDQVNRHFRMAAFARAATNNGDIHQEELQTNGHNTGCQLGMIATQLLHRTAISATVYYEQVANNFGGNELPPAHQNKGMTYTLSAGHLVLPRAYTSYKQTNLNVMLELMGQTLPGNGRQYVDIAPSLQFIFNSQTRVDVGYRHQLYSNMARTAPNGFMIRVEHLLFNVL